MKLHYRDLNHDHLRHPIITCIYRVIIMPRVRGGKINLLLLIGLHT